MHPLSLPSKTSGDGFASHDALEPIAIVGLATRFPQQATSTEKLWETLLQARSTWSAMPKERFNSDAFYHPDREHGGTFTATGGHYLSEDTALFDSSFFNITNKELTSMDPQQRLVLENVYHALENAGMPMANAVGSNTSVYVTGFNHDYLRILDSDPEVALRYKPTGTTNSILSNRVSWFFDFKGPSMTVDTACSSSLVALHLAVQSLRSRESNMAIVSGVSILESPNEFIGMSYTGLLGPQGRSFSFDSRAEGYARGEGVGTVVVKPLHAAIRDGDTIRAVIRETGVNQDGRTPGITVPSGDAQEGLIREVYWRAGLDLEHTRFVEAHGTGTRKGDPIEAGALARAFNCRRDTPLYVGAIKSTIGHLEGGSGVASLIKSIMVLESGIIPPNYDMQSVNPSIPAKEWNLAFPTENLPWPSSGLRRVSVNSFGIGGTNSHCILDDAHNYLRERQIKGNHRTVATAPTTQEIENLILGGKKSQGMTSCIRATSEDDDASGGEDLFVDTPISEGGRESPQFSMSTATEWIDHPKLFLLSAFDEEGVTRNAGALASYLDNQINEAATDDHILNDLSFTLSKKRSLFPWKSYVLASSVKELSWNLSELNFIKPSRTATPELHFVFTGQGAQYQLMGRELMAYAVFQESVEEASDYIRRLGSPWSLLDELLTERDSPRVHLPEIAQPLCTVLQIALLDLLASWNIFPARVTGHSAGEIAAAYCAGKISREAAWKAAYCRGYVSSKLLSANGTMMAVGLSASELEGYIAQVRSTSPGELLVACHNSPKNNTVSGDEAMVDSLKSLLDADGVFARKLQVQNAYHSAHMKTVAGEYLSLMGTLPHGKRLVAPHKVSMFSSVTGEVIKEERLDSQYWVDNMISPVRFSSGLQSMVFETDSGSGQTDSDRLCLIVEIGPHSTLQSAIKETLTARDAGLNFKYLSVLKRTERSLSTLLTTAGTLASSGLAVDFHRVNRAIESGKVRRSKLLVDLPSYSFKHNEKVLFEGRLTKNLRARKHPRHDLFGAPATDWNSIAPRWRHFFRLHENPWLRDHMVTGNCIYPGVGYLIMAIEASKQLAWDVKITGFELRRVHIKRAMIIPDSKEGVEVSLSMAVVEDPDSGSRTWRRFHITSYNASSEEWTEHCTGLITVNHEASPDLVDNGRAAEEENRQWKADFADAKEVCNQPINFKASYNNLETSGLNFGTLFRNLDEDSMPKQYMHSHLIHPATMDSMIHMMIAALQDLTGRSSLDRVRLPTFIRNAWISADLNAATSHKFTGHASVAETQSDKLEGQIYMLDEGLNAPCVRMNGIELTLLESGVAENNERKLCSAIQYKPDIHFLESHAACEMTPLANTDEADDLHWVKRLQLATMIYVTDALDECKNIDVKGLDSHLQRYLDWMKHFKEKLIQNEIIHLPYTEFQKAIQDETLKETISQELEAHNAECAITVRMGQNISRVLKGEANPLDLMFGQDSVMEQVYREGLEIFNLPQHLRNHLSLIRHQHSELKILEIGGGTGSLTAEVLGILSPDPTKSKGNISSYIFTDISSGFFDKAKERFQSWSDIFKFQAFNIEHNPVEQGLEAGTYDLIVAGNVIHATKDLHDALKNLRSLLKPGGQLIMQEGIRQDFLWYPLVFGQLPGWWLGDEPCRQWCPYIQTEEWNGYLIEAGLSGVDIEYPSSNNPDLTWQSILVSSNPPATQDLSTTSALILTTLDSSAEILSLQQSLKKIGYSRVEAIHPSNLAGRTLENVHCVSTIDLECQYLTEMNEAQFHDLRRLLTEIENLLWITTQPVINPHSSMIMGLLRTVRWERDSDDSNIITLTVPQQEFYESNQARFLSDISKIIKHQFWNNSKLDRHAEYLLQNGIIHIGRLDEWSAGDQFLGTRSSKLYPKTQRLDKIDYPIELQRAISGDSEIYWIADLQHEKMLADDEVEIEVRAVGLSSNASGYLSTEAAGVVTQIGSKVESILPGDRVAYISPLSKGGRCRTHERVTQSLITQIPSDMSFEIAAQLASVYATSIHGILNCAALTADDTILIHNGALAVSQAAIQCAQMSGATILTTVGTIEDRDLLVSEYNIPVDHIFSNKDLAFAKSVMRCTNGSGVDAVFNTMTGEALRETLSCLAPHGTFVDVAQNEVRVDTTTELASLSQNVSIHKVNMLSMADTRPKTARSRLDESFGLYTDRKIGQIRKYVVLSFAQIQEGIQGVQSGKYAKVVFIPSPADVISVAPKPITAYQFVSDATYVLAGGYGGLGRNLARWMVIRGAKNLLMLSRSSASSAEKRETVIDLEKIGCKVVDLVCDISDLSTLSALSDGRLSHLPPIKGCIQASMVLRDGSFAGMSFEDWKVATKPKVQGSWNLHKVLPEDMDFFVMLSSVAGILGNRGQANYAAGNTFQDALVAYRLSQGMNASSINLGSVSNIGWVAENRNSMRTHTATLFEMLREEEVQAAVEFLIDPRLKDRDNVNPCSQLVLGLPTAEMCRQNGVPAPTYLEYSMFAHLRGTAMTKDSGVIEQKAVSTSSLLAAASGFEAAVTVATNGLVEKLSSLLATPASEIDAHRFGFGGIDSLVAMEFRYWIVKELKADVSLLDIIGSENIKLLGVKIAERSRLVGGTT
ncbi:Acyl transferase/acyl hydrolase/lysophospholipase [Penicillium brevicompactum]|uniref:Acyl transferase/acyl hydrolase/lysophospholipase n=1 Tax=Penicillium brevicompactum TaxID=5074 RepID=A0A9W9RBK6_PENBR|nr:Acyl transferase/acyl hydrolase/lysophospholipase [Penicillium brevicompactum]